MIPPFDERPSWLKSRGYLHITPKIDVYKRYEEIFTKVNDERFVSRHAFFPLIHSVIKERKYKKIPNTNQRAHSYIKGGKPKTNAKLRPLHYATHIDALIYGKYATNLLALYEDELSKHEGLSDCIIAYRKILEEIDNVEEPVVEKIPGKSTIHFANEAFNEIKRRSVMGCTVLMFDIKSFFSELNHELIKKKWCELLNVNRLPDAEFNVFNSATDFRYILRDELRVKSIKNGRRGGFDEKKLAAIRKHRGIEAFYESPEDFRKAIKDKKIKVYKRPFTKNGEQVGIPQGLPISAVIANLYLLDFDLTILQNIVDARQGFYRRYSDDIMIICNPDEADELEKFVLDEIKKSKVEISEGKTEKFFFKTAKVSPKINRISAHIIKGSKMTIGKPLTYLGFEFYGYQTLIKSANLSKYYRRMVGSVKRKVKRSDPSTGKVLFPRQLKKIYEQVNLDKERIIKKRRRLVKNANGYYSFAFSEKDVESKGSYLSYARRASKTMNEFRILNQVRKNKIIFRQAIAKNLK
ncbi:reverse transcriptase domain-containing protein [Pedobacter agri]|uniref:reverse transcriptase domain-containing protein n=1 Tax=Pedobacter agri TaxID=454586 RepID=UPI00292CE31F|nr:reverse transcriptase domain-containing protein [Pedobacter agri]